MSMGSRELSALAISLAMSVLPVPGGPYSNMPFIWLMPRVNNEKDYGDTFTVN